ncbi:hypothetical protein MTO96_050345 [Rhipicephalus appendiculatus]
MLVRLRPSAAECCLAERISATGRPREVGTLDITNCLRLESHRVTRNTYRCMQLRYLRCTACRLEARDHVGADDQSTEPRGTRVVFGVRSGRNGAGTPST